MKNKTGNNHDHEKCREFFALLSDYMDRELDDALCREIEFHMKDCKCCESCLLTLQRTVELCQRLTQEPVPESLSQRLARIEHE